MKYLATIAIAILLLSCSSKETREKPNIIIFLVDDMGLMDTSVPMLTDENGNPKPYPLNDWYRTPNMERLASQGTRFSDFYAHPVCSPSRISIMSGQNSARHRTTDYIHAYGNNAGPNTPVEWNWEGLSKGDISLPSILRQNGLKTIHIGKAHFAPDEHEGTDPRNLGFDVNIGGCAIGRPGSYYGQKGYGKGTEVAVPHLEKYHGADTFLTEALTLEALAELDKAMAEGQAFFLYMSHYAVHAHFDSDPRFAANYIQSDKNPAAQAYATMVEGMDKSLGDLMNYLEEKEIAENTLIFFLSDNGGVAPLGKYDDIASSAPLRGYKGTRWEGGVRVPFIAAWAKPDPENKWQKKLPVVAGGMSQEICNITDLFPTILDFLDISPPANYQLDGQNLTKILTGKPDPEHRNEFLSHYPHPRVGKGNHYITLYRKDNWKVICHYMEEKDRFELYDLETDPSESNNLAASKPAKLQSMLGAMKKELELKDALYPVKDGQALLPHIP
jgi:arylsulfatase A-like enzyme